MLRALLLCLGLTLVLAQEPVPAAPTLPPAIAHLVEAQAQLQSACAAAGVPVPGGLTDVLIVRRTIAADWQRRVEAGQVKADDVALARFTSDLDTLVTGLQQLANLVQQYGDAPRRFPHCLQEAAYQRYRILVLEVVDQGMRALVAGRLGDQAAPQTWFARQARHTALLSAIEAAALAEERYAVLPHDDAYLGDYRQHLRLMRATLEQEIDHGDNDQHGFQQAVLDAYTQLLDARVQNRQTIGESGLPAEAPEVALFRRIAAAQEATLARLVALVRVDGAAKDETDDHEAEARRILTRLTQLHYAANQIMGFAHERSEQLGNNADTLAQAPAAIAEAFRAASAALDREETAAQAAFAKAVESTDALAGIAARQAFERVRQRRERLWQHLEEDTGLAGREQAWRAHAADPAVAEKLKEFDERRAAARAARKALEDAEDAALAAEQAAENATHLSEAVQEQADRLREAADKHDLNDLMEALDAMVELRAGVGK